MSTTSRSDSRVIDTIVAIGVLVALGFCTYLYVSRSQARAYYNHQIAKNAEQIKHLDADLAKVRLLVCAAPASTAELRRLRADFGCTTGSTGAGGSSSPGSTPDSPTTAAPTTPTHSQGSSVPASTPSARTSSTRTPTTPTSVPATTIPSPSPSPSAPNAVCELLRGLLDLPVCANPEGTR